MCPAKRESVLRGFSFGILISMHNSEKIWQGVGKDRVKLHHAYGLSGPRTEVLADVLAFLKEAINLRVTGNPDVQVREFEVLSVDESRRIKELQSRKALADRKVIIVAFNSATVEAQNALLKVLEEPSEHTHIFLIVPRLDVLLPTVRSRLFAAEYKNKASSEAAKQAEEFLASLVGERIALAKKMSDDVGDEKFGRGFVLEFVNHLEQKLWSNKKTVGTKVFDEIALCRNYLGDRSASVKMLLEHLAVALPSVRR